MSIDKLTDKLAEIASAMQGPGLEAAKGAAAAEAMSVLAGGALCGLVAEGFAYVMRWSWRRLQATGNTASVNAEKTACDLDLVSLSTVKPSGTRLRCHQTPRPAAPKGG